MSGGDATLLFDRIAGDLRTQNWSVVQSALPPMLQDTLARHMDTLKLTSFRPAGIGRETDHELNRAVRRDRIRWISGASDAERAWLDWAEQLRLALNRRLLLGLFSFESHFAHYGPGDFYLKHIDAFRAQPLAPPSDRVVSVVLYLNPDWHEGLGGQLLIYDAAGERVEERVTPHLGTLAVFLSDCVPHEVQAATRDRYSIAGWFRINGSSGEFPDPPR